MSRAWRSGCPVLAAVLLASVASAGAGRVRSPAGPKPQQAAGTLDVAALPGDAQLEKLGKRIAKAAAGDEKEKEALEGAGLGEKLGTALMQLESLGAPTLVSTHVSVKLGRAAWLFRSNPDAPGATPESVAVYLVRKGGKWLVADFGHGGLDAKTFLNAKVTE